MIYSLTQCTQAYAKFIYSQFNDSGEAEGLTVLSSTDAGVMRKNGGGGDMDISLYSTLL